LADSFTAADSDEALVSLEYDDKHNSSLNRLMQTTAGTAYECPSVIYYKVDKDNSITPLVGADVPLHGIPGNTFSAFKSLLGSNKKYPIFNEDGAVVKQLSVREILLDFTRYLVAQAKKNAGTPGVIIATFPVKFSNAQLHDLQWVFANLGLSSRILYLDEANAAVQDMVLLKAEALRDQGAAAVLPLTEYVLIYDLGGGTLDLTFNRIVYSAKENDDQGQAQLQARIDTLDFDGDPRFGGVHLTRFLQDLVISKFEAIHVADKLRIPLPDNWQQIGKVVNASSEQVRKASLQNDRILFDFAERLKIAFLSGDPEGISISRMDKVQPPEKLFVIADMRLEEHTSSSREILSLIELSVRMLSEKEEAKNPFLKQLNADLERSIERIRSCTDGYTLDKIILNGQAAQTPFINERLRKICRETYYNNPGLYKESRVKERKPSKYMKYSVVAGASAFRVKKERITIRRSDFKRDRSQSFTRTQFGHNIKTSTGMEFSRDIPRRAKLLQLADGKDWETLSPDEQLVQLQSFRQLPEQIEAHEFHVLQGKMDKADNLDLLNSAYASEGHLYMLRRNRKTEEALWFACKRRARRSMPSRSADTCCSPMTRSDRSTSP
jgi:hypothetical protein